MVSTGRHPKKPIAEAIKALNAGLFTVEEIHRGHRWGVARCDVCGDEISIWSTPRVPEHTAAAIARFARSHAELHGH